MCPIVAMMMYDPIFPPDYSTTNVFLLLVSITGLLAKETFMFLPSITQNPALRTSTPVASTYARLLPGSAQSLWSSQVSLVLLTLDQSPTPLLKYTIWAS